jgi:hypothetical protein
MKTTFATIFTLFAATLAAPIADPHNHSNNNDNTINSPTPSPIPSVGTTTYTGATVSLLLSNGGEGPASVQYIPIGRAVQVFDATTNSGEFFRNVRQADRGEFRSEFSGTCVLSGGKLNGQAIVIQGVETTRFAPVDIQGASIFCQ